MTEPPPIAEIAPDADVPAEVEAAVRRGLAKTWSDRIQSASEYAALLDEARRINAPAEHHGTPVPFARGAIGTPVASSQLGHASPNVARRSAGVAWWRRLTNRQLRLAAIAVGGLLVLGILAAMITSSSDAPAAAGKKSTAATKDNDKDRSTGSSIVEREPIVVPPVVPSVDRDTAYKAALHDLANGKTCPERQKAVGRLRALGDERAIPALKKARYRMRGGVLGIGDSNTNGCLKKDAEAAIRALGGEVGR
jgi:hypothetical protein